MAARMVDLGWIQKLDHANMPNVDANLIDFLKSPDWDPNRDYSVPWQSGMTGICYNSELTDPVTSFKELLTRPDLKGKVELLTEMRDTMVFMLLMQGSDPEDFTDDEYSDAIDALQEYVDNGQVRRFAGNDYVDDMKSGDIVACEAWSGDVINLLGGGKYKWLPARGGLRDLDRQHAGAEQGRAQGERREADELLLRPGQRGAARRVELLLLPGAGRPGGDRAVRQVRGQQRLHLPRRQDRWRRAHVHGARRRSRSSDYQRQFNEVMGG